MKPYISIIMPVYNNETYFPFAVESIKNQTFTNWELIIVDDGSTDKTPEIADFLAEGDMRIKVIHQENQWIYRSFNNGIAVASGKYVLIVNSDDTINREALQKIYDIAERDNADIVMFNLRICICDKNQNIMESDLYGYSNLLSEEFSYTEENTIHSEWGGFLKKKLLQHQCVYKTESAQKHKYRTDTYAGDFYYNIQIANEIKVAAGTNYLVYNHFLYNNIGTMNASVGKYYGYEHSMFNEFYLDYKRLFVSWGVWNDETASIIMGKRIQDMTTELRSYVGRGCYLTVEEKLDKIFGELSDDIIYQCALKLNRMEEYQSRILSGLRELMCREIPDENSKYYFLYELLESLLRYEKEEEDIKKLYAAVYHPMNPQHIGECFVRRLEQLENLEM